MIGSKKDKDHFSAGGTTLLARSVQISGEIRFGGTLEIEGKVIGNIYAESSSDAQVNVRGEVEGEIRAPKVMVNGHVTGDVYSTKHLELASKAVVNGNVNYKVIEMVKGAQVNGSLVHLSDEQQQSAAPPPRQSKKARVEPIVAAANMDASQGYEEN